MTTPTIALAEPAVTTRQMWSSFVAAEWIKLRTVRSTMYTLAVSMLVAIGVGAIATQHLAATAGNSFVSDFDAIRQSLVGNVVAQLAIGALGVLVVTSEFATGMIRSSLGAMPQRQWWIAAKLTVFAAVALVVGQVLTFSSFLIGQGILSTQHLGVSLAAPNALRCIVATGLYVALVGLMGAAFGLIIKHTAGALSTLIGVLYVLPGIAGAFSQPLQGHIMRLLPANIAEQAASAHRMSDHLAPWTGIALMVGYVAVLLVIGCTLLQRRDA